MQQRLLFHVAWFLFKQSDFADDQILGESTLCYGNFHPSLVAFSLAWSGPVPVAPELRSPVPGCFVPPSACTVSLLFQLATTCSFQIEFNQDQIHGKSGVRVKSTYLICLSLQHRKCLWCKLQLGCG